MAADQVRADRATARAVATELAAAQATARLLAVLPLAVLLLGNGLGGDPVGFLLATPAGLVCLVAGLSLEYAGLAWLARIADQVSGRRPR
jgi:tight adherence protein B